jgi:hypothetical protein
MTLNDRKLDIKSRSEVTEYLNKLLKEGKVKDCQFLIIEEGYLNAFYPKCTKNYAKRVRAINVKTDITAGSGPSSYFWPECPNNCPFYLKSNNFTMTLNKEIKNINYIDSEYLRNSTLNPLPIIIQVLTDIGNSDQVLELIHRSGISIDFSLSKKQDFSHKMRIREYVKRLNNVLQNEEYEKMLHCLFLLTKNIIAEDKKLKKILEKRLSEIGWEIKKGNLSPKGKDVIELFFPPGLVHSAYQGVKEIIKKANKCIDIIDLYIDSSIFEILKIKADTKKINVRILTKIKNDDFDHENFLFTQEHQNITIERKNISDFHDRFIILDRDTVYHLGASIKDAGNKAFLISKIEDCEIKEKIIESFKKRWGS